MTQLKTEYQDFDVLALEQKLYQDRCFGSGSFEDGDWDARMGNEPSEETWVSADYRKGYLHGIEEKYNDKFDGEGCRLTVGISNRRVELI